MESVPTCNVISYILNEVYLTNSIASFQRIRTSRKQQRRGRESWCNSVDISTTNAEYLGAATRTHFQLTSGVVLFMFKPPWITTCSSLSNWTCNYIEMLGTMFKDIFSRGGQRKTKNCSYLKLDFQRHLANFPFQPTRKPRDFLQSNFLHFHEWYDPEKAATEHWVSSYLRPTHLNMLSKQNNFQPSAQSYPRLHWFCFASLKDWIKKGA